MTPRSPARAPRRRARRLCDLRNLGAVTAEWLTEAGIRTPSDLERVGPVAAYQRLKAARPRDVTLVALWALAGALLDLDFREVPADLKEHLKAQLVVAARPRRALRGVRE